MDREEIIRTPEQIKERIRSKLAARRPRKIEPRDLTPSAVLMPLFVNDGRCHILLTQRSDQVEHHKNQISFPGGVRDPEDGSLLETALRETEEEIGVSPDDVEVLGELDDIFTLTRFRITPFVGAIPYPYDFRVSDIEIDRLIEVPVKSMLHNEGFEVNYAGIDSVRYAVYSYEYGDDVIWGATAKIITGFLHIVFGFEAPGFGQEDS